MNYHCDSCHKTTTIKSERKLLQSLTHNEFEKCIRQRLTIQNLDFFENDSILKAHITNHRKQFASCLFKYDFTLVVVRVCVDQVGGQRCACIKVGYSEPTRTESREGTSRRRELSGDVILVIDDSVLDSDWLTRFLDFDWLPSRQCNKIWSRVNVLR